MTAIIDGVTVIGTPSEIDSLLRIRERKTNTQWDDRLKELMSQRPNQPPVNYKSTKFSPPTML